MSTQNNKRSASDNEREENPKKGKMEETVSLVHQVELVNDPIYEILVLIKKALIEDTILSIAILEPSLEDCMRTIRIEETFRGVFVTVSNLVLQSPSKSGDGTDSELSAKQHFGTLKDLAKVIKDSIEGSSKTTLALVFYDGVDKTVQEELRQSVKTHLEAAKLTMPTDF